MESIKKYLGTPSKQEGAIGGVRPEGKAAFVEQLRAKGYNPHTRIWGLTVKSNAQC